MGFIVYDVSLPVHPGMLVWKDNEARQPGVTITREAGGVRESRVSLDCHTGTHVDAPLHMIPGAAPIDRVPIERLIGECRVIDLTGLRDRISRADLVRVDEREPISAGEVLLLKTRNSANLKPPFDRGFVFLAADAAEFLAEKEVRGVGIDYLGIERDQPRHPAHRRLLEKGIPIIEGLNLARVPAGRYFLFAAPLALVGVEAAPARVVLLRWQE